MNAWSVSFKQPVGYQTGLAMQRRLLAARQDGLIPDTVLLLQHTPVVTLGNRGRANYLLKSEEEYRAMGIELFHAERGGDVDIAIVERTGAERFGGLRPTVEQGEIAETLHAGLRHDLVHRLKQDFPALTLVINGGITTNEQIAAQLGAVDGVMLGREAYHHPWTMSDWDERFFGQAPGATRSREAVEAAMVDYMESLVPEGLPWHVAARHMMGLWNGTPGARHWRRVWSDHRLKQHTPRDVARLALEARRAAMPQERDALAA